MSQQNTQLYAYEGNVRYELDLFTEDPIKITISAENITDPTQVTSSFTRQFRIPATNINSKFFKWWYVAGTIDFDITAKIRAEIHIDGVLYKTGELRLESAILNETSDSVELSVIFLGETKDFASQIGEAQMATLDLADSAHILDKEFVEDSWTLEEWSSQITYASSDEVWHANAKWTATTTSTNSEPSQSNTDWSFVSNRIQPSIVRYILADRGYAYDEDGKILEVPNQLSPSEVILNVSGAPESFTNRNHALSPLQFTPIIQIKYLINKIFSRTDYTISADSIINEAFFGDLYIDGIATGIPYNPNSDAQFNAEAQFYTPLVNFTPVKFDIVNQNNASAYNSSTYEYTVPIDGTYTFKGSVQGRVQNNNTDGSLPQPSANCAIYKNGSAIMSTLSTQNGSLGLLNFAFDEFTLDHTDTFAAGDKISIIVNANNAEYTPYVLQGEFYSDNTPVLVAPIDYMKQELTQLDFLKSCLTKFRLVMIPSIEDEKTFIIKSWKDYIGSGEELDWTNIVDYSKSVVIEPLFFNQSRAITFTDQEDEDIMNDYHQKTFGHVYGRRLFDSTNNLQTGDREVETQFAPTPVTQIAGAPGTSNFIIPKLFERSSEFNNHGRNQHEPIVPVARLLYWNGLRSTGGPTWYYGDQTPAGSTETALYPCASYLSEIPSTATTLNLNWQREFAYFELEGGPVGNTGESVYERYWKEYIDNVYSPDARKLTLYVKLNSVQLRQLSFDSIIFIKDSYWRINKIFDAPLTEVAVVKVELIKLLQYVPTAPEQFLSGDSTTGIFTPSN